LARDRHDGTLNEMRCCVCGSLTCDACVAWLDWVDGGDGVGAAGLWIWDAYLGSDSEDEGYSSRGT
jgi:hypothetical protein